MSISVTQATIGAAIITSPLLVLLFDFVRNKAAAFFKFRGWHAVFLANGQVYFSKIASINKSDLKIEDIYYLKAGKKDLDSEKPELVKLGGELHGPEDFMIVSRTSVLFIEKLKSHGAVVVAIDRHKDATMAS